MAARRIRLPEEIRALDTLAESDYASAFELPVAPTTSRSPETWARATFEDAPPIIRWFMRTGWRFPLRFRLAPPGAPEHVFGCRIIRADPVVIIMEQRSPLMTAHNVVLVEPTRIVWATLVHYQRPSARPLWSVAAAIHHRVLPRLLARAAHAQGVKVADPEK
jgi:hypothetical protein